MRGRFASSFHGASLLPTVDSSIASLGDEAISCEHEVKGGVFAHAV